ncbi:Pleiotropic drug resistance protein [Vigna angularis]|uniref:Pleiotropic drug resistance protein n=1 Tax=Phaseolus angularis TaxID=3914 RepID=A0A8T0JFH8_PHAAN|nr:Pleiotropic drug resistance protein [Vigna angularis]
MANGSLTKATSSFQVSRSSIWRDGSGVFSRNSFEEDDEEALKWAALEKLPTYNRLKKGLLITSNGEVKEIDVTDIGTQERKHVLERLVRDAEEDNEKFLLKLRERIDRVGISFPTIEARFEHLNVEAEAYVGSRALPTFLNFIVNTVESYLNHMHILSSKKKHVTILKDVSGIVKPCRMTLLLGPPSSGKTTLLLALAGKLDPDLKVSGRVTYNGHEMNEFIPQRTSAYISQHDVHIGEMTVRETLAFSARCQGVGSRYDLLSELSRREIAANIKPDPIIDIYMKATASKSLEANKMMTEYILKILGLEMCADIVVGDETLRGVSGGQRKRVTTGGDPNSPWEMLVGPTNALFMDEISSGLDSSTTVQIIKCLRQIVHILDGTAVISLLQPEPETYELFDDIILLSNGQIVYQGPREFVLEFFESMGFRCPERKAVADFLQEVTSRKDQQQYWIHEDEPYSFVTVNEFAKAFQCFHAGIELREELAIQFDKTKNHPAALTTKKYGVDMKELLKANFSREYLLMKRNAFVHIFKLSQLAVMAVITMTVFLRTEMHKGSVDNGGVYTGALFFSIVMVLFNGMADISMNVAKLPIFYKQRDLLFYPAWAYAIPNWILKIPITLAEVVVWVSITYYVIGFDPSVGRFLKQYLLLLLLGQMASALFRTIAATGRNMIIANTFGSFAIVTLLTLGGFILSSEDAKKWWTWGYWISPIMYEQNAMMVNEFLGQSWSHVLPNSTESLGVEVLKSRGFFTHASWYWIGVGALLGFVSLLNITFTLALTFLNPLEKPQAIILKESHGNKHKDKTLQDIGLPLKLPGNGPNRNTETDFEKLFNFCASVRPKEVVDSSHRRKRGMILPFEPHSLTFDGIAYSVDMPQEMKNRGVIEDRLVLLKGVSGAFRPGVLTALMGLSGAGKTTLLDVLAGRKTGGYIEGRIRVSGYPKRQETYARISGYCEQNDIHSPHVTVYESLLYSAWLRLSPEVNSETRKMFIEEVMGLVELNLLREALVGLPGVSGLSTEQRKRLTIAVELVANPSIIFMGEPTSGLDARAAAIVMRTVRNIVDTGRTIVCTIHQPSIDIFEAFDERIEGVGKIKDGHNPAAWMLEITTPAREMDLNVDFADIYKIQNYIEELSKPASGSKELHFPSQYAQPFFIQCKACLWKQHWSYWRNPPYTAVRFLFTAFVALMFGTMFWDLGSKTRRKQDLFNAIGSMYNALLFLGIQNAFSVQPVVAIERTVFYRERAAGMYSAIPYALAQVVIEIPYTFVQAVTYGIIVYAMIGFEWTASKFFWYLFFMYFTFLYFTFYGMMTVAVTPNQHIASIVATSFYGLWNLFSGFVVPQPNIPVWWRWYYWACPVAWTLYGLAASQFGDVITTVEVNETVKEFLRRYFGYRDDFVGVAAGVVVGFAVLFATIFALSVKVFNFERR